MAKISYTGVLAFNRSLHQVAMVQKQKGPSALKGKWNGIGGKIELGESPVGAAMREFTEETGIAVHKDDMVFVEHQRFVAGQHADNEVYWYATQIDTLWRRLPALNDAGEPLKVWNVDEALAHAGIEQRLCPNMEYMIPKALVYLRTPYLERPA